MVMLLKVSLSYIVTLALFLALCVLIDTAGGSASKALMTIVGWLILFFPVLLASGAFYFIWGE